MKILITVLIVGLLAVLATTLNAQTFVNFQVSNAGTNFWVPTNTLVKLLNYQTVGGTYEATVKYPSSTNEFLVELGAENYTTSRPFILGPATIIFPPGESFVLMELDPVNVSPSISGLAVQPSNSGASIALETSTDLKTWQATTNGIYDKSSAARFFRMNLSIQ
ncbi:MAG TPA: hypothetical protein VIK53_12535 [Verrucomicrobiae bacterium]